MIGQTNVFQSSLQEKLRGLEPTARAQLARKVSDDNGYCSSAVTRWFDGETSPHPVLFDAALTAIDAAKSKLGF